MATEETPTARCAFHQNQAATFTCERCGNFGCELCRALSKGPRCAACYAKGEEEVRQEAPQAPDLQDLFRDAVGRPLARRWAVLGIAALMCIPNAIQFVLIRRVLLQVEPLFPKEHIDPSAPPPDMDKLFSAVMAALEPHLRQLDVLRYSGALAECLWVSVLTVLFAAQRPSGGLTATSLGRYPPLVLVTLLGWFLTTAGLVFCCLPAVPAYSIVALAGASVVLGGVGPIRALMSAFHRVLPHLGLVVGTQLVIGSLWAGSMMLVISLDGPLQSAFGEPGVVASSVLLAFVNSLINTVQVALGVVLFEKLPNLEKLPRS